MSETMDIPLDVRTNRAEQEARKFYAEQQKLMREADKLLLEGEKYRAEAFKIWRDWRMMPWVFALSLLSGLIGALIGRHL
jgi:hypothetical protein